MLLVFQNRIKNKALRIAVEIVSALTLMIGLTLLVYFLNVPNPNMILISGLLVVTASFGLIAGILSGLEMILYSWFFFSSDRHLFSFQFTEQGLIKLWTVAIGVVIVVAVAGYLTLSQSHLASCITRMNEELKLDNKKLTAMSQIDYLTQTKNRFAFRSDYQKYLGKDLYFLVIDIDDFKRINDLHGHQSGDLALVVFSRQLKETFGEESCYRFGGDEFVVLNHSIDESSFKERLERFRQAMQKAKIKDGDLPIHFSAGYVHGTPKENDDLRLMLKQADEHLYEAKSLGKDQCVGGEFSLPLPEAR